MAIADAFVYSFTISRQTQSGSEDGTPLFTTTEVVVPGFFDDSQTSATMVSNTRLEVGPSYQDRRAVFLCATDADVQDDDEGVVTLPIEGGGVRTIGRFSVEVIRHEVSKRGLHHLAVMLLGVRESG